MSTDRSTPISYMRKTEGAGFSGPDTEERAEPIPYSTELTSGLGQNAEGNTGQEPRERG